MAVVVDEAGGHIAAGGVDGVVHLLLYLAHPGDDAVLHQHVRHLVDLVIWVDNMAVFQQQHSPQPSSSLVSNSWPLAWAAFFSRRFFRTVRVQNTTAIIRKAQEMGRVTKMLQLPWLAWRA